MTSQSRVYEARQPLSVRHTLAAHPPIDLDPQDITAQFIIEHPTVDSTIKKDEQTHVA